MFKIFKVMVRHRAGQVKWATSIQNTPVNSSSAFVSKDWLKWHFGCFLSLSLLPHFSFGQQRCVYRSPACASREEEAEVSWFYQAKFDSSICCYPFAVTRRMPMVLMALRARAHTHFVCDVSTSREANMCRRASHWWTLICFLHSSIFVIIVQLN